MIGSSMQVAHPEAGITWSCCHSPLLALQLCRCTPAVQVWGLHRACTSLRIMVLATIGCH